MNLVTVIGNVTRDPEVTFTKSGMAKVKFTVASNGSYTASNGEKKETTDYINVVAWGKLAECVSDTLFKGTPVILNGRYTTSSYEGKDGSKNYYTCVTARYIGVSVYQLANGGSNGSGGNAGNGNGQQNNGFSDMGIDSNEPIPF